MKRICLCLCVIFAAASLLYAEDHEIRRWTSEKNSSGKVFSAEGYLKEVRDDGKTVILVIDGKEKKIDVSRLSSEDRDYLNDIQSSEETEGTGSRTSEENELEESSAPTKTKTSGSFAELKEKAEGGDPSAQKEVGDCYLKGNGVDQDFLEAGKWYHMAAERGHVEAEYLCAFYFAENVEEMVKWIHKAAEHGFADAQCLLGLCYSRGDGVTEDKEEAVKWFRKAAKQGHSPSRCHLGLCYLKGEGVPKNWEESAKWMRKAAEQGFALGQYTLGEYYRDGIGVTKDKKKAIKWYRKAAEQGDVTAQCRLALCYKRGDGVPEDKEEAAKWFAKAAEQGNADAQYNLGTCYNLGEGLPKDIEEARKWYAKAAEQGNAYAQFSLVICSVLTEKDKSECVKCLSKAAERGDANAQYCLGHFSDDGKPMLVSQSEAIEWLRKAASQGHELALNDLKKLGISVTDSSVRHESTPKADSIFENDSQRSTVSKNEKVTFINYLKITEGMSKQQVFDILGPGQKTSSTKYLEDYQWKEKPGGEGGVITIDFVDGKVLLKSQSGFINMSQL